VPATIKLLNYRHGIAELPRRLRTAPIWAAAPEWGEAVTSRHPPVHGPSDGAAAAPIRAGRPWTSLASIEQMGQALLHLIGDVERQGLDRGCRVHATGSDEQTAIDDEQVLHIVRPPHSFTTERAGSAPWAFNSKMKGLLVSAPLGRRVASAKSEETCGPSG
jgi:hypothetical protein